MVLFNCETIILYLYLYTRDIFCVRRVVDLMKTASLNVYIMYIFGKIELLSKHAINYFKCTALMISKRQRHTYIPYTGNMLEI